MIAGLDSIRLGDANYNPLTGLQRFLVINAIFLTAIVYGALVSDGIFRWVLAAAAIVPTLYLFMNLKNRLVGIWHRHYFPMMYLWAGASGVVEEQVAARIYKIDSPFNNTARLFLGLAFPTATDEDARSLIELTYRPIFQYYVAFGALNSDLDSDDPKLVDTEKFCTEQEATNPDLIRRVKLFALIIFKQVGREGAARFLTNWGALV